MLLLPNLLLDSLSPLMSTDALAPPHAPALSRCAAVVSLELEAGLVDLREMRPLRRSKIGVQLVVVVVGELEGADEENWLAEREWKLEAGGVAAEPVGKLLLLLPPSSSEPLLIL
jgi:hypothetical protein